jgi:penicillin-binding protein 1C
VPGRNQPAGSPRIVFRPANAVLEAPQGATLFLEAAGGTRPYRWAVHGIPLREPPAGGAAEWLPDGPGFATLALTDAAQNTVFEMVPVK